MKTNRIAELLAIRYPIFQAPMGRTAPPELAAAVTNAGGLGMLGTSWDKPDIMRKKIRATRALTDGPFAVNLAMPWDQHERLEIALEEGVKAVSLFWGDPIPYIRKAKDAGATVMHTVATPLTAVIGRHEFEQIIADHIRNKGRGDSGGIFQCSAAAGRTRNECPAQCSNAISGIGIGRAPIQMHQRP